MCLNPVLELGVEAGVEIQTAQMNTTFSTVDLIDGYGLVDYTKDHIVLSMNITAKKTKNLLDLLLFKSAIRRCKIDRCNIVVEDPSHLTFNETVNHSIAKSCTLPYRLPAVYTFDH